MEKSSSALAVVGCMGQKGCFGISSRLHWEGLPWCWQYVSLGHKVRVIAGVGLGNSEIGKFKSNCQCCSLVVALGCWRFGEKIRDIRLNIESHKLFLRLLQHLEKAQ